MSTKASETVRNRRFSQKRSIRNLMLLKHSPEIEDSEMQMPQRHAKAVRLVQKLYLHCWQSSGAEIIVVASKWEMTEGYFGVHRSSSPTSLFGAASGRFTSTTIVVSDCEDANGIFTLGTKAVVRALDMKAAFPSSA